MINIQVEMSRLLKRMTALQDAISPEAIAQHHAATTTGFLKNRVLSRFESEGDDVSGKWPRLSDYTIQDRARKGFPPERPILRRTGALRKWVMDSPPATTGEVFMWPSKLPPNNSHIAFAYWGAQVGNPGGNLPRRRIVVVNMADFLTIRQLLEHRIAVALNA